MAVKRLRPANKTMINFINKILTKIFGPSGDRVKKELQPVVDAAGREDRDARNEFLDADATRRVRVESVQQLSE